VLHDRRSLNVTLTILGEGYNLWAFWT